MKKSEKITILIGVASLAVAVLQFVDQPTSVANTNGIVNIVNNVSSVDRNRELESFSLNKPIETIALNNEPNVSLRASSLNITGSYNDLTIIKSNDSTPRKDMSLTGSNIERVVYFSGAEIIHIDVTGSNNDFDVDGKIIHLINISETGSNNSINEI